MLREYLLEDLACAVDDFLFVQESVRSSCDHDGVVLVFTSWTSQAKIVISFDLLLSFGQIPSEVLREAVMYYCVSGRKDLLLYCIFVSISGFRGTC